MLVKLDLSSKPRFIYKIKSETYCKNNKTFFIITAPHPRNTRQRNKLIEFLTPYEKYIIYPKGFNKTGYPAAYPAFEIYCKNILTDFLNKCKKTNPQIAVITPNEMVKDAFYFELSEYVGKIIVISRLENEKLKASLLAHSGTVLEFRKEYNKNEKNTEYLYMPKNSNCINDYFVK